MRIWKRIFPEEPFDDARLRQTFHWALKATEAFLAYEHWQKDTFSTQLALFRELSQRNVGSAAARALKKADQLQQKVPLRNEKYLRDQYQLEIAHDSHRVYYQLREKPRFQEIADFLDLTYFIEKLKASGNLLFDHRVHNVEYEVKFLDEVVAEVEKLDLNEYPVLAIHYYGYRGLTEDDESGKNISLLRDTVEKHGDLLTESDLRHVILMAINLCISNMNQGREIYIRESFEWYKIGFINDVIIENNLLTRETYLNVISIALKLNEFAWADEFIGNNSDQLEDNIRENTESFAKARLGYERKDSGAAMRLLVRVDFKHPVYNLLAKTLLLKIYYELDEFDAMDSQLDSMTTYIRRKKLSDLHKDHFGNIVRYVRQLSRIPHGDREKLEDLRNRILETSPLAEKKWLLEQLDVR